MSPSFGRSRHSAIDGYALSHIYTATVEFIPRSLLKGIFMKKQILGSLLFALLIAVPAMAGTVVERCSNGEETRLVVKQTAQGVFQADVTVQSVGDSYPTFHFKNLEQEPRPANSLGAPLVYSGKGFELVIGVDASEKPATLTIPSLSMNRQQLSCK
jgi:hypothetical protein